MHLEVQPLWSTFNKFLHNCLSEKKWFWKNAFPMYWHHCKSTLLSDMVERNLVFSCQMVLNNRSTEQVVTGNVATTVITSAIERQTFQALLMASQMPPTNCWPVQCLWHNSALIDRLEKWRFLPMPYCKSVTQCHFSQTFCILGDVG